MYNVYPCFLVTYGVTISNYLLYENINNIYCYNKYIKFLLYIFIHKIKGHVTNYLSAMGCVLYYLKLTSDNMDAFKRTIHKGDKFLITDINRSVLRRLYKNFSEEKMVFWILIITLVTLFFSSYTGLKYGEYSLIPLSRGFCNYE